MDCVIRIWFVGLLCTMIGMLGALVMVKMIDRSNNYIASHPPDKKQNNEKEGDCNGRS